MSALSAWPDARPRRTVVVDLLLATGLLAIGQALVWTGAIDEGPRPITAFGYGVVTAALVLRRLRPLLCSAALAVAWVGQSLAADSPQSILALVVMLIAAYSAGAFAKADPEAWVGLAVLLVTAYAGTWLAPASPLGDRLFTSPVLVGGPWVAGLLVRRFREQARRLSLLNEELEWRRAEDVLTAAAAERARLARDLHDVVAHHLSLVVVQAGAAGRVLPSDPGAAGAEIEAVRRTAQEALAEMRRLLGVLRSDDQREQDLLPAPGLEGLDQLVATLRAAGLPASLCRRGGAVRLEAGRDVAAYRIVQEALTNTLRHARASSCHVVLDTTDDPMVIEVRDDGTGATPEAVPAPGSGHGLVGMRERAAYLGARLEVGPQEDGGWLVRVAVPIAESTT